MAVETRIFRLNNLSKSVETRLVSLMAVETRHDAMMQSARALAGCAICLITFAGAQCHAATMPLALPLGRVPRSNPSHFNNVRTGVQYPPSKLEKSQGLSAFTT